MPPNASASSNATGAHSEGYLWLLQNDPEVPPTIREEARQYGFPKDEFTDNRHRPHHIYVRQGRRIWGEYNFTQRDAALDKATGLPRRKPDGIAVAEFGFDSHGVHKYDPAHPGVREGYIFIEHQPLQLPYRILVPKGVDGTAGAGGLQRQPCRLPNYPHGARLHGAR